MDTTKLMDWDLKREECIVAKRRDGMGNLIETRVCFDGKWYVLGTAL